MGCRLTQNIKHSCEYNPGGISNIFLLDIRDFVAFKFLGDKLFDQCYAQEILKQEDSEFIQLGAVNESQFTESSQNGIYNQELKTFVRSLSAQNTSRLLLASTNRYLVIFKTYGGSLYSFGMDEGAKLSFTQISGQLGAASGYEITLSYSSLYPLIQLDDKILMLRLLATEDNKLVLTEDERFVEV